MNHQLPVNANEQYNLGVMYAYGQGVTQDYQEALKWFRLSAAQGNLEAQGDLGAMYQAGLGVPQDYTQAMMWYLIAKAGGTTLADQNLQQVESLSTPEQIAEAQRMARDQSDSRAGNDATPNKTAKGVEKKLYYEWSSVVIWAMFLFLLGLSNPGNHVAGTDTPIVKLGAGIFLGVMGGLFVATYKYFKATLNKRRFFKIQLAKYA